MRCDCSSTALLQNNQTAILNGHWWIAHIPASNQSFHTTAPSEDCRQIGLCALASKQLMNFTAFLWFFDFVSRQLQSLIFFLLWSSQRLCCCDESLLAVVLTKALQKSNNFLICSDKWDDILPCMFIRRLSDVNEGRVLKQWKIHTHKFTAFVFSLVYNAMKSELV